MKYNYDISYSLINGIFIPDVLLNEQGWDIRVKKQSVLLNDIVDIVQDYDILNIPNDITYTLNFVFQPMIINNKEKYVMTWSMFFPNDNLLTVSPHLNKSQFIEATAHELVHAEQLNEGRFRKWRDEHLAYQFTAFTTFEEYVKLPWEAEAYARQTEIAEEIKELL